MWFEGFLGALTPNNVLFLILGSLWGMFIGILPALGSNFAVALMLPFTFGMEPATAMIFLCAAHVATNYGDSLASILVNVPGGPGTVATCWDGNPMTRKGQPGRALGIATFGSFFGGVVTWFSLVVLTKPLTELAFLVGAPEYFALGLMALTLVAVASKGETIKGLILVSVGLLISTIGQDPYAGETFRFSFGIPWLEDGIDIVIATLGIFAIGEIIRLLEEKSIVQTNVAVKDSVFAGLRDVINRPVTLLRAGFVGWFVGILPALGISLAGIASYLTEKGFAKDQSEFGKGSPTGLLAAEVGKGACVIGDLIPSFLLGVPGSVTGAILMAALILHGIDPGPMFLKQGALPYIVFWGLLLGLVAYAVFGPFLCRLAARLVFLPNAALAPLIAVLTFMGAYMQRDQIIDLFLVILFGIIAFSLEKVGYPLVCLVLGLILGPLVEANLGRALSITYGSPEIFLQRPIAMVMIGITIFFVAAPYVKDLIPFLRKVKIPTGAENESREELVPTRELITLGAIILVIGAFLAVNTSYPFKAAMFPNIVGLPGLILAIGLFGWFWWRRRDQQQRGILERVESTAPEPPVVPYATTMIVMLGFAISVYVVGLVIATILFVLLTAYLAGIRKKFPLIAMGVGAGLFIILFARLVQVQLPVGFILEMILG